jgi:N-acetylmuramoyl-L-alanine amidase
MQIVISSGHGLKVLGASGYIDEVNEARVVVEAVADVLLKHGFGVVTFHDDVSTTQNENLETIVEFHNQQQRDLDVSIHFNAYTTTDKAMGTEVLYASSEGADHASHVVNAMAKAGFINRGAKKRTDLYFLNQTDECAILIEVCFVDSRADCDLYEARFDTICRLIAASLVLTLTERTMIPVVSDLIPPNQMDLTASVFGGKSDYNVSAYDEDKVLNDTDFYVALPDRFEGERPRVVVCNAETGAFFSASIEDVGPWNIDDPYWLIGERPQAESGTDMTGRTTNGAGIDLSPALAAALGIDGLGKAHWKFE